MTFAYYIVMDEVHFFIDDAPFNTLSEKIFWDIMQTYQNHVQIFLSATMVDFCNLYCITYQNFLPSHPQTFVYQKFFYKYNIEYYINTYAVPKYNIILYNNEDFLIQKITDSKDEKWLIFTSNITKGKTLQKQIQQSKTCRMLSSKNKSNKTWNKLINSESFDSDVLIATKVIDNGVNIVDDKLTNIVLPFGYPTEFLQMIGRKRFRSESTSCVNIYVRRLTDQELRSKIKNFEYKIKILDGIDNARFLRQKISFIKKYWTGKDSSGFDIEYTKYNGLMLNYNLLAPYNYCLRIEFYDYILSAANNPQVYFDLIKNWLGNNINEFKNISQKTTLYEFLEDQVGIPIMDPEIFYTDFLELYRVHCKNLQDKEKKTEEEYKNLLSLRQAKNREKATINEGLKKLRLPFVVKKSNNNWVVMHADVEK